jgi:cation-transporting ATPase I
MRLPNPFALASKIVGSVTEVAGALVQAGTGRRVWTADGRTHLEVRGIHRPETGEAAAALRARLLGLEGVRNVEVNAVLGRVVVAHDPGVVGRDGLAAVVGEVEREHGLARLAVSEGSATHPANAGPGVRELVALGTNVVGVAYSVLGTALPFRVLPPVLPALVSLADSTPRLRVEVETRLGRPVTDAGFAVGGAVAQALGQQPIGLLTDVGYRYCMRREVRARQGAWRRWEHSVADRPEAHRADPVDRGQRPRPLPNGPVERAANTSAALALAGYLGVLAGTRSPARAVAFLHSGVPRAAKVGREAFAAQLATDLSHAGTLVLEPDALRRLDRVDTVVVDASTLLTGRHMVSDVVAVEEGIEERKLLQRARDLVDVWHPLAFRERGAWAIMPIERLTSPRSEDLDRSVRETSGSGVTLLALTRKGRTAGVVRALAEVDPFTEALCEAARRAGSLRLAGADSELRARLGADDVVPGGSRLLESVRGLQEDGHVVAVVSGFERAALAAADVGLGVPDRTGAPSWGAHLQCPGLAQTCLALDAVAVARRTSRHSAQLAVAGSSFGVLLGTLGPAGSASLRAAFPVHFATLLALGVGTWFGMTPAQLSSPVPVDRTPWHAMSRRAVLNLLGSSNQGLDEADVPQRRPEEGLGGDPGEMGLARASAEELANPLTPALAAGAGVSASLGAVTDAVLISGVLAMNALIGGAQRIKANRELRQLSATSALRVRLRRGAVTRTERADKLVPGDVLELQAGDAVPADCRLLEARGLEVDESTLTGESQLVTKGTAATTAPAIGDRLSMLYQGTMVAAGRAVAVVVATGDRTEVGRTSKANVNGEPAPITGVAARLRALTRVTLPVTLGAGVVLMGSDLLRGQGISQALNHAVSLAVAAVPEGLPFVATVAELASARRLSQRGVLVRTPATIEALGRVDVLCFDKTGTLTEGRISLRKVSDGRAAGSIDELTPPLRDVLAAGGRASPWHESDAPLPHPTDRAVLDGAREQGVAPSEGLGELAWVDELRFEPSRGYHAVLARHPNGSVLSVKGAPEAVLGQCIRWRSAEGDRAFDAAARAEVDASVEGLARQGFRVLAVAERSAGELTGLDESHVTGLDFRGLLALADPVRHTAAEAVDQLRRAGIDVMMITGDHPSTAEAIAAELNLVDGSRLLTGVEIDSLDEDELTERLGHTSVCARVSPAQKARIVRSLHRGGRVVAMTGDGANDVPAIRLAHVGIALGTKATPAAREAADLVVTDDRIETITDAIVEGRAMWSSVRDALSILLGGNLGEIGFALGSGLFSASGGLNARQLLLVNLLTDVLPAMAVAVRPPPRATPEELLAEGPDASLGSSLTTDIYLRAATTAGAALCAWLLARPVGTPAQASTTGLVALVGAQLGQTMAVRGRTPLVILGSVGSLAALVTIVQIPGISQFFGCSPLMPHQWAITLGAATAATVAEVLIHAVRHSAGSRAVTP